MSVAIADKSPRRDEFGQLRRSRHLRNDGMPKFDWVTREAAEANALKMGREFGSQYRAYQCDCGGWHVGQVPGRQLGPYRGELDRWEVGEKVARALAAENHPIRRHRLGAVRVRGGLVYKHRATKQTLAALGL